MKTLPRSSKRPSLTSAERGSPAANALTRSMTWATCMPDRDKNSCRFCVALSWSRQLCFTWEKISSFVGCTRRNVAFAGGLINPIISSTLVCTSSVNHSFWKCWARVSSIGGEVGAEGVAAVNAACKAGFNTAASSSLRLRQPEELGRARPRLISACFSAGPLQCPSLAGYHLPQNFVRILMTNSIS